MSNELLSVLRAHEVALHQQELRREAGLVFRLLHDDFIEFGRSGSIYSKADTVQALSDELTCIPVRIWSQDYCIQAQSEGLALLLYKSAQLEEDNQLTRHALRSSLWRKTTSGWQMIFHQGTPVAPFRAAAVNESAC
ncbi:DUF4440 domain-containing protein [Chitiniphilus shinanonensis]|uniref:nuclear transport factor 2 family protein n=1 Tax=Chitiniphilus shinanonensis TaxID=553088 RepID=UPI00334245EF